MTCHKSDVDSIKKCVESLQKNKVVIIPTDTVYGFSGIVNESANARIKEIKGRGENKPFIQLIANPSDIFKYTSDKIPEKLLSYWPGPLTIIVNDNRLENKTTAFRCPGDKWLRDIISKCEFPLYSTSVNRSGSPVLENESEIVKEFEDEVDLIVLDGNKNNALPSTIVSFNNGEIKILRKGAVDIES